MIWDSVFLMTFIDIFIIATSGFCAITLFRFFKFSQRLGFSSVVLLVFVGLTSIAFLYLSDFTAMHILPFVISQDEAMALMKDLHLNWSWILSFIGVGALSLGLSILMLRLIPKTYNTIEGLKRTKVELAASVERHTKLQQELKQHKQQLEYLVLQRTKELEASNRELESYSYSIAHDLRTPLRAITSFSQVLLEETSPKLSSEEREYLHRIVNASKNMADLIDDILGIARVSRADITRRSVDVSKLARRIAASLTETDTAKNVAFEITDALVADADPRLLKLVLENLFGNAWKYTRDTVTATIAFGATTHEGETIFYVRDNGIGFDMKYAEKIFEPFQRLHTCATYPGTGIGLATVKRIIEKHGGQIWPDAEAGNGATFFFTLDDQHGLENSAMRAVKRVG